MKKTTLLLIVILSGVLFTYFLLKKDNIYAKEEYSLYAFQVGYFNDLDNATKLKISLPSSIIINKDNGYYVYVGIYKNIDLVNKMLVYFEDNNINIYLKNINVSKNIYNKIDNYEKILLNSNDNKIYNMVNQSILDMYLNEAL